MSYEAHSILVIDVSPFGRSLALLPALVALRRAYPRSFIAVAASRGVCELSAGRLADETIDLGVIRPSDQGYGGALGRVFRLIKRARRREFDLVLDFSPRLETQALSRLVLRARTITPPRVPQVLDALLGSGRAARADDHLADCVGLLGRLGIVLGEGNQTIELAVEEDAKFEQLLARHGSRGGEPVVVLHASGAGHSRGWPVESFGELAVRLTNNFGARVVAADDPSTTDFTDEVGALLPRGAIRLPRPAAAELLAAVARASIVVTDDAGLARMAAGMGTPALELADRPPPPRLPKIHRVAHGGSRSRITTDEVYEIASEMLQDNRTTTLFQR